MIFESFSNLRPSFSLFFPVNSAWRNEFGGLKSLEMHCYCLFCWLGIEESGVSAGKYACVILILHFCTVGWEAILVFLSKRPLFSYFELADGSEGLLNKGTDEV